MAEHPVVWEKLLVELLRMSFAYLDVTDLCASGTVCVAWRAAALDDSLWKIICAAHWRGKVGVQAGELFRATRFHEDSLGSLTVTESELLARSLLPSRRRELTRD